MIESTIGALHSITTRKMSTTRLSRFAKESANTGSLGKKSEMEELLISKDTPRFADGVLSMLLGINLAQGRILKAQEVILDKIENIAVKVVNLEKEVLSLKNQVTPSPPVMNLQAPLQRPLDEEMKEFMNSLENLLDVGTSADITCYETL